MKDQNDNSNDVVARALEKVAQKVCVALSLTLYFRQPLHELQEGLARYFEQYLESCEQHITWYADSQLGRFRRFKPELRGRPAQLLGQRDLESKYYSWIVHGGVRDHGLSPFQFEAANTSKAEHLNYVRATFPLNWRGQASQWLLQWTREWSSRLPLFYGYGGFAFNESPVPHERQANSRLIYALSQRFAGVEVDDPFLTARSEGAAQGIKGVNWLTLLSEPLLQRLGGLAALKTKLGPESILHPFSGGVMIQAGPEPGLGDLQAGEQLPAYREIARALKPIRVHKHFPLGPEELGSFGWEGTQRWLTRFD